MVSGKRPGLTIQLAAIICSADIPVRPARLLSVSPGCTMCGCHPGGIGQVCLLSKVGDGEDRVGSLGRIMGVRLGVGSTGAGVGVLA